MFSIVWFFFCWTASWKLVVILTSSSKSVMLGRSTESPDGAKDFRIILNSGLSTCKPASFVGATIAYKRQHELTRRCGILPDASSSPMNFQSSLGTSIDELYSGFSKIFTKVQLNIEYPNNKRLLNLNYPPQLHVSPQWTVNFICGSKMLGDLQEEQRYCWIWLRLWDVVVLWPNPWIWFRLRRCKYRQLVEKIQV